MAQKTLYQILEIPTDAGEREIKRSYHTLAKRLHPDRAEDKEEARRLEEQMALVSQAYNTLKDPKRRAEHDAQMKTEQSAPAAAGVAASAGGSPETSAASASAGAVDSRRAQISQKALAKGLHLLNAGDAQRALEFLEAAVANNDGDAQAQSKLAEAMLMAGKSLTRATEHAERAIDLDPWNVNHRLALARIYERAGVTSRALDAYREVLKWDANSAEAEAKIAELSRGGVRAAVENSTIPFARLWSRLFDLFGRKG